MTFINTDNAILNNTGKVPYIIFQLLIFLYNSGFLS